MPRLSPRIVATVPATLDTPTSKIDMVITSLGLNGAYLQAHSPIPCKDLRTNTSVLLQYSLIGVGFEHRANIIRNDNLGCALDFPKLDFATKGKLWEYMVDKLGDLKECPYCGTGYSAMPATCPNCGWNLDFNPAGYFNYYERNCTMKKLHERLTGLDIAQLQQVANYIDIDIAKVAGGEEIQEFVGTGSAMLQVFADIRKVAPTDLTVLILGESGTGKELTAQAIHERSSRKDKPFVAINCAAIPDNLLEAELFGYEKGAYTGAHISKKGKFEIADSGTIFLDEIGDMPPNLQAKLLRFLQDRIVERIGTVKGKKVNVRLIAATNRALDVAIAEGKFRSDLYYRLDEFTISLPPVRDRGEDVLILAKYFLNKFSREAGLTKTFTKDAADAIRDYAWPGNVREIINKVRRAVVMASGKNVTRMDLVLLEGAKRTNGSKDTQLSDTLSLVENEKIKEVLKGCSHNISNAAQLLGISRPTLYRRMKIYGIE